MKNELQVEIISPTEAEECNPFGKYPPKRNEADNSSLFNWQIAEENRRVFKIAGCNKECQNTTCEPYSKNTWLCKKIGSPHTAECNIENLTCIIK